MANDGHGRFHWNELLTNDVEAAKTFYGEIMGWTYDEMTGPEGAYYVAFKSNNPVCAIAPMPAAAAADTPAHWFSYIEIDQLDASIASAKAAGATVLRDPLDLQDVGRIAIVQDPTGAVVGWVTPDFND
jgi:predicted enzyme related to lactoylglutathione lyase